MAKSKMVKILSYIALLLAVIAVFGIIAHFTGGFTTDFKTFYVTVNGKDVMSSNGGYSVTPSEPITVDVKYTFAFANDENKGFSVKVVPNKTIGEDFYYTAGGETHSFYEETDLTNAFEIMQGETSFTIKPKGATLTETLQAFYGKDVSDCENHGYADMFTVVVTSYNGEASVKLHISIPGGVSGIKLDKTTIIF